MKPSHPARLRLSRAKGYNLQRLSQETNGLPAVKVTRPGRWGNPFHVTKELPLEEAIARYREALLAGKLSFAADDVRTQLRGKNLACWCPAGGPCHADILLEIANRRTP